MVTWSQPKHRCQAEITLAFTSVNNKKFWPLKSVSLNSDLSYTQSRAKGSATGASGANVKGGANAFLINLISC
jgi:hypothetical protein